MYFKVIERYNIVSSIIGCILVKTNPVPKIEITNVRNDTHEIFPKQTNYSPFTHITN